MNAMRAPPRRAVAPRRALAPGALGAGALGAAVAAAALTGCAVGPRYVPPTAPAPATGQFAASTPAVASAEQPPSNWWQLYETPAIDQLVQTALTHNKNLLVAAANLAEARAALTLARTGLFPSTAVSAGAQYGVSADAAFAQALEHLAPAHPSMTYSVGLDVSYEVDLFGRIRRTVQAAKADYEAQQAAQDATRISVAGETTRAYVNACAYAQQLDVARHSLNIVTQNYELTLSQANAGAATDFDVARARELVAQIRATLPTYEGERRTALFELAVLTGRPPEEISAEADACKSPPVLKRVLPIGDVGALLKRRPDVRQAERELAANVARIGIAAADLYPTVTIGGSAASSSGTLRGLGSRAGFTYGIGPLLSWSFPNIAAALAEVKEARATASAAYAGFQAAVLQALEDTETALTAYGNELDRNASLLDARDQSQIALSLAQSEFELGRISYLDFLTAETDLVNTEATLAASSQALASDQVTVFKALGGGWEQAPDIQPLPIK
jgi:NodT family efflux transporter outer membrane factor (OMF) lipoprotein